MANSETRDFTSAQIDGPKNPMGYPDVPYTPHALEFDHVPKQGTNDAKVLKHTQPQKRSK